MFLRIHIQVAFHTFGFRNYFRQVKRILSFRVLADVKVQSWPQLYFSNSTFLANQVFFFNVISKNLKNDVTQILVSKCKMMSEFLYVFSILYWQERNSCLSWKFLKRSMIKFSWQCWYAFVIFADNGEIPCQGLLSF